MLAVYAALLPRCGVRAALSALLTAVILVALFWPAGVSAYLRALYGTLNLGETNTIFPRFQGLAAGPNSLYFSSAYTLTPEHLGDLLYMLFWSGSLLLLVAVVPYLLFRLVRWLAVQPAPDRPSWFSYLRSLDRRVWFALAVTLQQGFYFCFMIPKLGPQQDIDLFFSVYISIAFFLGAGLDVSWRAEVRRPYLVFLALALLIGVAVNSIFFLLKVGIPVLM